MTLMEIIYLAKYHSEELNSKNNHTSRVRGHQFTVTMPFMVTYLLQSQLIAPLPPVLNVYLAAQLL